MMPCPIPLFVLGWAGSGAGKSPAAGRWRRAMVRRGDRLLGVRPWFRLWRRAPLRFLRSLRYAALEWRWLLRERLHVLPTPLGLPHTNLNRLHAHRVIGSAEPGSPQATATKSRRW
jgi:hypothetical protein